MQIELYGFKYWKNFFEYFILCFIYVYFEKLNGSGMKIVG
jgi:hypothetical protein